MQQNQTAQKIITVSGLHSGIGKTSLCEHIISLLPGIAAIKITINDQITEVLENDASIMVEGKDTWRLKTAGATKVVWVRAQEEKLAEALARAREAIGPAGLVLIEGNSMLAHIDPALAFFVCDERICSDAPLKPSRTLAISRAHVVVVNIRRGAAVDPAALIERIRGINPAAAPHVLDLINQEQTTPIIRSLLLAHAFQPTK